MVVSEPRLGLAAGRFFRAFYTASSGSATQRNSRNHIGSCVDCCSRLELRQRTKNTRNSVSRRWLSQTPRKAQQVNNASPSTPSLSDHLRQVMRRVPHPVTVITASDRALQPEHDPNIPVDKQPIESTFRGMTVSSFNTVTMSPAPLVSFNVRLPSATYTALSSSGTFLAHIMASSSEGVKIANVFAQGGNFHGEGFAQLAQTGIKILSGPGTNNAPFIIGDGVMRVLSCKVLPSKQVVVGDHVVVLAEVFGLLSSNEGETDGDRPPSLIYVDRAYRSVGAQITETEKEPRWVKNGDHVELKAAS